MKVLKTLLLASAVSIGAVGVATAAPITVSPGSLSANGNVTAVFAFADAGDTSQLLKLNVGGVIFTNRGPNADAVGSSKSIGSNSGLIQFQLVNQTNNYSFINDVLDSVDGAYHAKYGTTAADFGVTFSAATNTAIAALSGVVTLVGFEDRRGGDYDYNDLIFAFSAVTPVRVPEPVSMAVLGAGLLGLGIARRRRNA